MSRSPPVLTDMESSFMFLLVVTLSCPVQTYKICRSTEFSCGDERRTCVPMIWRCDGDSDCLNGADEEGCDKICRSTEFSCGDERRTCVPMIWRCDGDSDCLNGADEEGCEEKQWQSQARTKRHKVKMNKGSMQMTPAASA
ncbi:low-density lipoprotein receptor-like isoform X1 [Carassius auratus]|uniref:Low-density lipoprotein receptor-like isoform X1 n=1 Tax=Carassius auratus TaxID=7957 RepID=A0A6P6JU05_CARAU|nr:low-density lipoprotein receptor-like isoform X1 [Carassius auratus]